MNSFSSQPTSALDSDADESHFIGKGRQIASIIQFG